MSKIIKFFSAILFISMLSNISFAEDKPDCSKIKNDTLVGNLKYLMCKKGSDKLDSEGNFKEGTFKLFKKKS